jgi:hypothetical protein
LLKLTRPWNSPRAKLVLIKGTLDLGDGTSTVGVVSIGGKLIQPGSYTAAQLMALGLGGTFSGTGKLSVQR